MSKTGCDKRSRSWKPSGTLAVAVLVASWLVAVPFVVAGTFRSGPKRAPAERPLAHAAVLPACTIVGTAAGETLVGTPGDDVICALGGDDVVRGRGGDDVLFGSLGDDSLAGGRGNDRLYGHFGSDRLRGGPGRDWLQGGGDADVISGGSGFDVADYAQRISPVRVTLGRGANDGAAGEGDDVRRSVEGARGGRADDTLIGNAKRNRLLGRGGDDELNGRRGNDRLRGGRGQDRLEARDAGRFVDRLNCGPGSPDTALADGRDVVASSCEEVNQPEPPGGRNRPPTDILLSDGSVPEAQPVGTVVGTLDAPDADAGDSHTFALVNGPGSADNGSFTIVGDKLRTAAVFDFEVKSSYTVRVRVRDARGAAFQKALAITVTDVPENHAPTDVSLSPSLVDENEPVGTTVGSLAATDADSGDAHTFALVPGTGDADNGSFTIDGDTLKTDAVFDFEAKSSYSIRVAATDALGATFTKALTVSIGDVNEAPTGITLTPAQVAENEPPGTSAGTLAAADEDVGQAHSYALVSGAGDGDNGSFEISGTTLMTKETFDFETKASYSIRVRVTDGGSPALSFEQTFVVTVTDGNEPPTAVDDSATVGEDSGASAIAVLANDTDTDGGPMSVASVTQPANGTVVVTGGGAGLTYEPDANYCDDPPGTTPDTFTYTLNGGSSATVSVKVSCVDDAPIAVNDGATVAEDSAPSAIDVLANDDNDGGPISIESVTQPANGTVVITGGGAGLTYQPDPNYCNDPPGTTDDTFTYTLNGGSTVTVSVTVTCVDDPPAAVDDSATVAEDSGASAIDVLANDANGDGGPLAIASASDPANGTVLLTGGSLGAHTGLTYAPDAGYCNDPPGTTTDTFAYTLNGGSTATVSVKVTCADDPPTAVDDSATVAEDSGGSAIDVLANDTDTDGGPTSVASVTQPANGTVVVTGGGAGLSYEPDPDYCNDPPGSSPDTFTYTLNGGDSATVSVTVSCVDDAPVAVDDSATVAEDAAASAIDVLANDTDLDGGPMSVESVTQPANGTVVITGAGAGLTYEPDPDYCNDPPGTSDDTLTYTLNGGDSATVSVTVSCVDDAPVAVGDSATVDQDASATAIDVLANDTDVDAGPLAIASASNPANGTVVLTGGLPGAHTGLTYEPDPGYCNNPPGTTPDTFTYTLNGGSTATVSVKVTCADVPPTAVDDSATVGEDSGANAINVLANETDPDGGPRSVESASDPANGTVVITAGGAGVTYEPDPNYCNDPPGSSPDTFTYTLNGGSTATVSVTVTCVDDIPIAVDDGATVAEDSVASAIDVLVNDDNDDGGPMSVASVTQPANGTVVISGGGAGLTYQPDANYCNDPPGTTDDTFTYTLNGGSTATVSVTVTCVDDAPTAVDDSATVAEDSAASAIDVLANDSNADGGPMAIASASDPANGTVVLTGGSPGANTGLTFQPDPNYCNDPPGSSPDTFTYTLNGGSTATVSVTVTCVDDPPTAIDDSATVGEDSGASSIGVLTNDTDADGGPKTISSASDPANGTVVLTGGSPGAHTGLTYQPDPNYCNSPPGTTPDTFTYTINGGSTATVSVTVTCVDDAPIAVNDSATVAEDSGASAIDVLANDDNDDGGPMSIASASNPANGTVALTGGSPGAHTGLTYQPAANYCNDPPGTTDDTFTYTLNGGSTATVSVTVTCAPDNPVVDTSAGSTSYTENAAATAIDSALILTDPDAGTTIVGATVQITGNYASGQDILALAGSHPGITSSINGDTLTLTGNATLAAYQSALRDVTYANGSDNPSTLPRTVTFTVTDDTARSGSDTKGITVTATDDPPVAVNDGATVLEDAAATAVTVLTNDTDVDAGPKTISSASDPANGTVVLTGGSPGAATGLTYQPDANYCNDPPGTTKDTFTYTLNGGSTATVSVSVTCVNDAPVADDESFSGANSAVGNTTLVMNDPSDGAPATPDPTDTSPVTDRPHKTITGDILDGDSDIDGPGPLTITAGTFATNDGGSVTIQADGDFTFEPAAATSCTDTSDFFDYTVSDQNATGPGPTPGTDTGRVTIAISGCVWYVNNDDAQGNSGTSEKPFDTLAQAETASGTGHSIFVYDGNDTSTGYAAGINLKANQKLIGEAAALVVGSDNLHAADAVNKPSITDNGADVVDLASGNEVRGFNIDPQGSGGGIFGGATDTGGTIDDVNIVDTGTAGSQPGLELDSTTGTFNVSNLTVNTSGATGVRLNNAGTVSFASAGTISITSAGAAGLVGTGTNMGTSTFDAITVTGSSSGGVNMSGTSGTTTFGDLALTTTSGGVPAFGLANAAGTVSVGAAGTDNVSATGGPAVDVTGAAGAIINLAFDAVSSTNSAGDGINLAGLGAGTFSAASGAIAGVAGIAFDLDGGSGAVSYPGALNNGAGATAEITSRSGGVVALSGAIADTNDAGGGISLSGNTGGSTTFSNASKVLNTTTSDAVSFTGSDGHTLTLSGGGLDIDTTTGQGLVASNSGTLTVSGTANTVDTGSGRAVNISNTDIGTTATFQRVSSNAAVNGILLNNTGAGAFSVTGTGVAGSGGTILNSTGTGVSLTTVPGGVSFSRSSVVDSADDGIGGSGVAGLSLDNVSVTSNGDVNGDNGVDLTQLTGTSPFTNTTVSNNFDSNVFVSNASGVLNLNVTGGAYSGATGGQGDGIFVEGTGTGSQNLNVQGPITFANNVGDHVQHSADADNTTDSDVTINNATMTSPPAAGGGPTCALNILGGGITLSHGGNVVGGSNLDATVTNNNIQNSCIGAIAVGTSGSVVNQQIANVDVTIQNNTIGTAGVAGSGAVQGNGIFVDSNGNSVVRALITGNTVRQWTNRNGLSLDIVDGDAEMSATVRNNVFTEPNSAFAGTSTRGMTLQLGTGQAGDSIDACLDIGHPTDAALKNRVAGTGEGIQPDIRYLHEGPSSVVQLAGYSGPSAPAIGNIVSYLQPRNNLVANPTITGLTAPAGSTTTGVTSCPLPTG